MTVVSTSVTTAEQLLETVFGAHTVTLIILRKIMSVTVIQNENAPHDSAVVRGVELTYSKEIRADYFRSWGVSVEVTST